MTLADLLLNGAAALLLLDVPVAFILTRAALHKPHIWALSLFALVTIGIGILVTTYVVAAANAAAGYVVARDVAQLGFRAAALVLAMFPPLFLWVYKTGRFRDGGAS